MSKPQLFMNFVNERLALAALDIFGMFEKMLADSQEEIHRSRGENDRLQRMLLRGAAIIQVEEDLEATVVNEKEEPEMKVYPAPATMLVPATEEFPVKRKRGRPTKPTPLPTPPHKPAKTGRASCGDDVRQLPEAPQIKQERDLRTSQGAEQLQGLQFETTDSIFPSLTEKTHCEPKDSSQLHCLDHSQPIENRGRDASCLTITEVQIKAESDEEDYGAPEPAIDSLPPSVNPNCPTAQSSEDQRRKLLPELPSSCFRLPPTRVLKSPAESRNTQGEYSRPVPSPCLRTETSPWPWPSTSSYSGSESEDVHSAEVESKTAEKPFETQCEFYDKDFSLKYPLVILERNHTGEKPFKCEGCDRAFNERCNLIKHSRVHTGEKPYMCKECNRAFSDKSNLAKHRRIHTGEKPYTCEECDRAFSRRSHLVRHRRVHAKKKERNISV